MLIAAVGSVISRPTAALVLLFVLLVMNILAEVYLLWSQIASDYEGSAFSGILVVWVNMTALAVVAVGWHRIVLLGEAPRLWPRRRGTLYCQYFLRWFVLGILIMLALYAVFGLLYLLMTYVIVNPVTIQLLDGMWSERFSVSNFGTLILAIPVFIYLYFLFRIGVLLPHLAIKGVEEGITYAQAWALTRPQRWTVFWAAVGAGLVQSLVFMLPLLGLDSLSDPETGYMSKSAEYGLALLNVVIFSVGGLFGAAILTENYRRITPQNIKT